MRIAIDAIADELTEIAREAAVLERAVAHIDGGPADPLLLEFHTAGLAALVEGIYTGIERALAVIAREIDGSPIEKVDGWHRALIDRMSEPFGNRQAVLTSASTALLNELRGFRHKVRNNYSSHFDAAIVRDRTDQAIELAGLIRSDIGLFLAALPAD